MVDEPCFWPPTMPSLSTPTRLVYLVLDAFAQREEPFGMLNDGVKDGVPIPATTRRLARWARLPVSTMHRGIEELLQAGLLKRDGRRRVEVLEVVSVGVPTGNRVFPTGTECSPQEQNNQCSPQEHPAPPSQGAQQISGGLFGDEEGQCSPQEHNNTSESTRESLSRKSRTSSGRTARPRKGQVRRDWIGDTEALRDGRPKRVLDRLDAWLDRKRDETKSGEIQGSTVHGTTEKLLLMLDECGDEDAWLSGMETTVEEARKLNYTFLASCIETAKRRAASGPTRSTAARQSEIAEEEALLKRGRAANAELHREDEEQNRQAREERERREARGA